VRRLKLEKRGGMGRERQAEVREFMTLWEKKEENKLSERGRRNMK